MKEERREKMKKGKEEESEDKGKVREREKNTEVNLVTVNGQRDGKWTE